MPPLSAFTSTLPANVLLETGVLYAGSSIYAAHIGGIKFDPGKSTRGVEFDGKRTRIRALDRTLKFEPKITGTVIELAPALVPKIEPGATAVTLTGAPAGYTTGYRPKQGGVLYVTGDYVDNVRAVWQLGDGSYVQVRFYDGAFVEKWDLTGQDYDEAKISIELCAVLDMTVSGRNVADGPYAIEYFATAP